MYRLAIVALCSMMTAAAADVAGKWNVTAQTGSREMKLELELKDAGGKLSGTLSSPQGSVDVTEVKLSGNELTFKIPTGEATYAIKFNVDGDSMKGTWSAPDGNSGAVAAQRAGTSGGSSASASGIAGKWKATAITPAGQEMKVVFDITESGGRYGGSITTADGQTADLSNVKFENNEFTCGIETGDGGYKVKMTLAGGTLKGTYVDPSGQTGKVSATK